MRANRSSLRHLVIATLAVAVVGASGCSWLKKENELYAQSPETRPLEVPPDLDLPSTAGAMQLPGSETTSVTRSETAPAAASDVAFLVPGERDAVYARVGEVLGATSGVTVNSSAQLLGTYDVTVSGSGFLVRVSPAEGGVLVSAVDPRGVAASGEAATGLMAALKTALAQ